VVDVWIGFDWNSGFRKRLARLLDVSEKERRVER
jgi:hypothetical protein